MRRRENFNVDEQPFYKTDFQASIQSKTISYYERVNHKMTYNTIHGTHAGTLPVDRKI